MIVRFGKTRLRRRLPNGADVSQRIAHIVEAFNNVHPTNRIG